MRPMSALKASVLALPVALLGCSGVDVSGVVRDSTTHEPIEGATVRIGEEATTTDSYGYYELEAEGDDEDVQRFHVDAPGYMGISDQRRLEEDPESPIIDFDLQKDEAPPVNPSRVRVDVNADAKADAEDESDEESKIKKID